MTDDYTPRVNTFTQPPQYNRGPANRDDANDMLSYTNTHKERLWDAVNYPSESELDDWGWHQLRYTRQPEAKGLIDNLIEDIWGNGEIDVTETQDSNTEETEVEKAGSEFRDGDYTRKPPIDRLTDADKQATLGKYSVLVLGFDDGEDPENEIPDGALDGTDGLNWIYAYDQGCIDDFDTVDDVTDERFGLPETYDIDVSGEDDGKNIQTFHHSRVIHLAKGGALTSSDNVGEYALKPIAHPLINLEKIQAAGAEGYWRGAYQGLVLRPPTDENGIPMTFDDSDESGSTETHKKITKWEQNFDRVINTTGEVDTLDSQTSSPIPFVESQYRSISLAWGIPQSILMGNETGERATVEDRANYHETLSSDRDRFEGPMMFRPIIQRLIDKGVFPAPADGFSFSWPALEELTEMEKADIFETRMKALKEGTNGQPTQLVTWGEIRNKWMDGWDAQRGSEEPDDLQLATADFNDVAEPPVDESSSVGASNAMEQNAVADGGTEEQS